LSIAEYGRIVAVIAAISCVILIGIAFKKGDKKKAFFACLFWMFFFACLAMVPVLIPVTVYSYGLMLAIAVVVCTLALAGEARRNGVSAECIFDLVFWAVVGGIIGARVFYVFLNYSDFAENLKEIIMIQNGGLAWQGALAGGFISVLYSVRAQKLSFSLILDLCAPYMALGQSIGRIGCYLNGCCYGKAVAWGIFSPIHNDHLHPTQLYLTAGYLLIFIILKRYQKFSECQGLIFALYLILASCLRFGVEYFRADHEILFLGLSIFQYVSFGILLFAFSFAYAILFINSQQEELK